MKRKNWRDDPARLAYSVEEVARILGIRCVDGAQAHRGWEHPGRPGPRPGQADPEWWVDQQVRRPADESP